MLLHTYTNVTEINGVYWNKLILVYYTLYVQHILQLAYVQKAYPKHLFMDHCLEYIVFLKGLK